MLPLFSAHVQDDIAVGHHQGPIAQLQGLAHVVGDHHAGDLFLLYDVFGQL